MRAIDNMTTNEIDMLKLKGMLPDVGYNKPTTARKSLAEAWQRAADKHNEQYADDIFPDGREARYSLRDEGRSDGQGESYAERNT